MIKRYLWLQSNLDKYQYNTEEAKALMEEYKSIKVEKLDSVSKDVEEKLEDCYRRFNTMFNNNPMVYKNGLKEYGIEANEFDCYFVKRGEDMLPVGYYKENHAVECVLLLKEKAEKQRKRTLEIKNNLVNELEKNSRNISDEYLLFKKVKKANYFRAILGTVTCAMVLWYCILFFVTTDIWNIITSLGNMKNFMLAVENGMSNMPVLSNGGFITWLILLVLHLWIGIIAIKSINKIRMEYVLTYQRGVTSSIGKKTEKVLKKINLEFEEKFPKDEEKIAELSRRGLNSPIERNSLARTMKNLRNKVGVAQRYTKLKSFQLRGIPDNKILVAFTIIALLGYFCYNCMSDTDFKKNIDSVVYNIQYKFDNMSLRSVKLVEVTEDTFMYKDSKINPGKVICSLKGGQQAEITEVKLVDEENWSKLKIVTDEKIIKGWVLSQYIVPQNTVDTEAFEQITIESSDASSYLVGDTREYLPSLAHDGDRSTSWQDGNKYDSGKNEYIVLYFGEKTKLDCIQVFPGNAVSNEDFVNNERIKTAKITFSDNSSVKYEFDDSFEQEYQTIRFNKEVETEYVKILVEEVYSGEMYTDLCVSEIRAFTEKKEEAKEDSQ